MAELIRADRAAGTVRGDVDPMVTAVLVGGGLDAIVGQRMRDPDFDTRSAANALVDLLRHGLGPGSAT